MKKTFSLAVSCGGTGGHFYPGLAVARAHKEKTIVILGGKHAENQTKIVQSYGIEAVFADSAPPSLHPKRIIKNSLAIIRGFFQARKALKKNKIDALLAMGSFTSLPVVLAAKSLRIPIFLHDGNARIGKANRFLSRWAKKLFTAFEIVNPEQCGNVSIQTIGMPIRNEIVEMAKTAKNPKNETPIVLIFGGSLGAKSINTLIPEAINTLPPHTLEVIHLTGGDVPENLYPNMKATVMPRHEAMGELYNKADFVICRAGGSTISELALFGKPSLLIPYPFAAEDHQNDNANFLVNKKAAWVIQDNKLSVELLKPILDKIIAHDEFIDYMAKKAKQCAFPHASENILEEIQSIIK